MEYSNKELVQGIKVGNIASYEALYKEYYVFLCLLAEHIVRNHADAEEIVSDVFVKLWNIRGKIDITTSIKAYLVRAVHNTSLNYIERAGISYSHTDSLSNSELKLLAWESDYPLGRLFEKEITKILEQGISELPNACRQVFLLSRDEDMTYNDIADKLGISVNTVKAQIKNALARLRITLKDYMMILMTILGFNFF
jgi:RNA polymerase sigma-70 factor, ECF subfamily